jgi:hypothetical protein
MLQQVIDLRICLLQARLRGEIVHARLHMINTEADNGTREKREAEGVSDRGTDRQTVSQEPRAERPARFSARPTPLHVLCSLTMLLCVVVSSVVL